MPRVSITIPTFNCARFLGRAIESDLAKTYADYEIIVVDDGSTDDTQEVLARFGDKIRYVYQANGGLSSARNLVIRPSASRCWKWTLRVPIWTPALMPCRCAVHSRMCSPTVLTS